MEPQESQMKINIIDDETLDTESKNDNNSVTSDVSKDSDFSDIDDESAADSDIDDEDVADSDIDDEDGDKDDDEGDDTLETNVKKDVIGIINDDEDNDEFDTESSDDEDEDYLKKFDNSIKQNYIDTYHPELKKINYDEINTLTKVVRNKNGLIVDPLHKTVPILTKFEKAKILGLRVSQLNNGSESFVKVNENIIDNFIIAERELDAKLLPFIVSRPIPNGKTEYWKLEDLELVDY